MKTRIVAALVASLALLTTASADAGPRRRAPGGATRRATTSVAPPKEHATKPASLASPKTATAKSSSAGKEGTTQPASLSATTSTKSSTAATQQGPTKQGPTKQGPTKQASFSTTTDAPAQDKAPSKAPSKAPDKAPKGPLTPGLSRFIAAGIPLAEVRDGRLKAVGTSKHPCGTKSQWAKKGSSWTALDAWGQIAGALTVSSSERYEGTGCHQVAFAEGTGKDGLGVFVAKGSGYSPAPSAKWNPAGDVVKRFEHLYSTQTAAWVDSKTVDSNDHGKTLFFNLPKQEGSVEGAPTLRRPTHWAVAGGRVLVVAYVGATGAWKVGHVLAPNGKEHAYEPLAVLDMNGDGLPEIVVHEEAGGVFSDRVLSFDAGTMRWENAVESPGGATP